MANSDRFTWSYVHGGTQLAISVLLGFCVGFYLDHRWHFSPWGALAGAALGLAAGLYNFLKPFLDHADRKK